MKQLVSGSTKLKSALDTARKAERDLQKQIGDVESFRRQRVELRANERALAVSKAAEAAHRARRWCRARQAQDALTAERKVARDELKRLERQLAKSTEVTAEQTLTQERARNRLLEVEKRYAANTSEVRRYRSHASPRPARPPTTLATDNKRLADSVDAGRPPLRRGRCGSGAPG